MTRIDASFALNLLCPAISIWAITHIRNRSPSLERTTLKISLNSKRKSLDFSSSQVLHRFPEKQLQHSFRSSEQSDDQVQVEEEDLNDNVSHLCMHDKCPESFKLERSCSSLYADIQDRQRYFQLPENIHSVFSPVSDEFWFCQSDFSALLMRRL